MNVLFYFIKISFSIVRNIFGDESKILTFNVASIKFAKVAKICESREILLVRIFS